MGPGAQGALGDVQERLEGFRGIANHFNIEGISGISNHSNLEVLDSPSITIFSIFIVSSVIGCLGNGVILFVIFGSSTFRRTTNYLVANLSLGSMFYIGFGIFAMIYRFTLCTWPFGLLACQWYSFLKRLPVAILSFTTTALTADRNHIVGNPLNQVSSRQTICIQIVGIWTTAGLIMTPLGITSSLQNMTSSSSTDPIISSHCIEVWTHKEAQVMYSILLFLIIHLIPVIIMILGMWRMRTKMKFLLQSQNLCGPGADRRVRLMRNSLIFTIIFITCWLPTGIFRLPLDLPSSFLPEELRSNLMYYSDVCGILGYFHTCVIPVLLFVLSHDLRRHLCLARRCCMVEEDLEEEYGIQGQRGGQEDESAADGGDQNQNDKVDRKLREAGG